MPIYATDLMIQATVYVEANDPGHAKRRATMFMGTRDEPASFDLAGTSIPLVEGITLDPNIKTYTPRRASIDGTAPKEAVR